MQHKLPALIPLSSTVEPLEKDRESM